MRPKDVRQDSFRRLADIAPLGIFETDADGAAVYVNPWLCELVGETEAEALADGWGTAVHPDDADDVEAEWVAAMAAGSTFRREHRLLRPDGSALWVLTTAEPILQPDGSVGGYLGTITDVTTVKDAELAVRDAEARFRQARKRERQALVEVSPDPTLVVVDGAIVFANAAALALFGARHLQDLLSRGLVDERFVSEQSGPLAERMERLLADGGMHGPAKLEYRRLDGTIGVAEAVWSRFRHEGQPAVLLVTRDVTDRVRLEEQLRQAQKMEAVGRLAGGVAHDFNNLLVAISGYAELSLMATKPDDELHGFMSEILRAADRASLLTQRLLTFSRQQPPSSEIVDLNEVIRSLDPMLRQITDERTRLVVRLAAEPAFVRLDGALIEQSVLNLLINARDAMPNRGTVVISVGFRVLDADSQAIRPSLPPGRYARLSVTDTGEGIAPEHLPHLFEPFFTTKPAHKGTGLGLSIVYSVVTGAGGTVLVDSTPGQGTRFDLLFPLSDAPSEAASPVGNEIDDGLRGSERLLVVEDEPAIRRLVERVLTRRGYRVRVAASAEEALDIAQDEPPPALLLTDVLLPAMSGPELADVLRARMPSLGVLFVSGYSADRLAPDGQFDPGTAFLAKPFSSDELARSVRRVLDSPLLAGA